MHYKIDVKQSEPTTTAVIRSRVRKEDLSKFVPFACGEVWSFARSTALSRPGRQVALYLNEGQGSVEVGAEVGNRSPATIASIARNRPKDAWPQPPISAPTAGSATRMRPSASGALSTDSGVPTFRGKSMAIGKIAGTTIPPRSAQMFSTSSTNRIR